MKQALNGDISFIKFFEEQCDCKFTDEDLNAEGNKFTQWYYDKNYIDDLVIICDDCLGCKTGDEYNLVELNQHLDEKYNCWKNINKQ